MAMRVLADMASKTLGQPIVVVNKPGGGGAIAYGYLAQCKPDGYTIGGFGSGASAISPRLMPVNFDTKNDFDFVLRFADYFMAIGVSADSPWNTLEDLLAYARKNPGKVTYGTSGANSAVSFSTEVLASMAGVKLTHVPFDGGVASVTAVLGGHIDVASCAEVAEYTKSGQLRMLAVFSDTRHPDFPTVPTLKELGYDIGLPFWLGIVGPKGMPEDRLRIMHDAFKKAADSSEFTELLKRIVMVPAYTGLSDFRALVFDYYDDIGKVMKDMGLTK